MCLLARLFLLLIFIIIIKLNSVVHFATVFIPCWLLVTHSTTTKIIISFKFTQWFCLFYLFLLILCVCENSEFVVFFLYSIFQYHRILFMKMCEKKEDEKKRLSRYNETMHVMRVLYMTFIVNGFYSTQAILTCFVGCCLKKI